MSARGVLRALDRALLMCEQGIVGGGILGIAALGMANVFARNLAGGSLPFAEELNQTLMVWITFAGVGLGARRARHIRMAAFYDQLGGRARKFGWMAITAGTAALLGVLTALAVVYVTNTHAIGGVTPALRIPLWATWCVVPVGLAIGTVEYALAFARNWTADGIHASFDLLEGEEDREDAP